MKNIKYKRQKEENVLFSFWKLTLIMSLLLGNSLVYAQSKAVTQITTYTQPSTITTYTGTDNQSYNWGSGDEVILDTFTADGNIYSPSQVADKVLVRRVDNDAVTGEKCSLFAERDSSNDYNLMPSLECDPAKVMAGRVINRGWLDVFSNEPRNNIERVDFVFTNGLTAPSTTDDLGNIGFITTEKSGNNPTVMAVITGIDGNGNPTSYAPLVKIWPESDTGQAIRYGMTGYRFDFTFLQDGDAPVSQNGEPIRIGTSSEDMGIAFVTLDDLGIGTDQTIYGFSYFSQDVYDATQPNNVASGIDPVDYTTFSTDTSGAGNVADADMYGGVAGYFSLVRSISGKAYDDANKNNIQDNGEDNLSNISVDLYADTNGNGRLDSGETKVASTETNANGEYSFNVGSNADYLVIIDANDSDLSSSLNILGNSVLDVGVTSSDITNVNFRFSQLDTDSDGIPDAIDLDDDNDGILDSDEGICTTRNYAAGWYNNNPGGTFNQDGYVVNATTDTHTIDGSAHDTTIVNTASPYVIGEGLVDVTPSGDSVRTLESANEPNVQAAIAGNDYLEYEFTTPAILPNTITVIDRFAMADSDEAGEYYFSIEMSTDNFVTSQRLVTDHHISSTYGRSAFFELDNVNSSTALLPSTSYKFRVYIYGASAGTEDIIFDDLNFGVCTPLDTDNDGIADNLDLDSDNDGIPDNVEAQLTAGYTAPTGTDTNNDGVDDAYAGGLTPVNSDGMDAVDYLDGDSDNDGISDTIESGLTLIGNVGINGLDNGVESSDNYTDVNGNVNLPSTDLANEAGDTSEVAYRETNHAPVAVADSASTPEDTAVVIDVLANDSDTEGDALTITNLTNPSSGVVAIVDGKVTYTPNANYTGTDSFTYTPNDGTVDGSSVTVTVVVNGVNDAPVAVADSASTPEDTAVVIDVLANDSDTEGDALTITNLTNPANGVVAIVDGKVTYTPNANYTGTDTFTYTPNDGTVDGSPVTVTVVVNGVNDAPVAVADSASTPEDTAVVIDVLANDSDTEGDALTITNLTNPANGVVAIVDGKVTYTPNANYTGTDTFTYTPNDGTVDGSPVTVTVVVNGVNDAPVAVADSASTPEDTAVVIDVLANDSDTEGDALTITNLTNPANGVVAIVDGKVTYTPNANYTGTDTFTYTPNDGTVDGSPVTVTVVVNGVNDAPVAVADSASTPEDTALTLGVADIVTPNDTDIDGDALTITAVSNPSNGSVVLNEDGTVTFTPSENFVGEASFEYTISDGTLTDTATVTVNVTAVNDAPVGVTESATTDEDTAVVIDVLANDNDTEGDTLTITNLSTPSNGTVAIVDGKITYTPNANFTGSDSFTYTPNDGTADGEPVTVTVSVGGVNDAPVAVDDTATVAEDTALTLGVADIVTPNDTDIDGDALTITAVSNPSNGSVVLNEDGTVTFTPSENFVGEASFEYTISDGTLTDTATVTVTVTAVNDAPVAVADSATTDEDVAVVIDVLANDTDTEGDTLVIKAGSVSTPSNGVAVINGNNIDYTPNANFTGSDSFTYIVNDGTADGNEVTVTVSVGGVNDAPVAVDDTATVAEDTALTLGVADIVTPNDTDIDGDLLTITAVSNPSNGSVILNGDGTVTFTPSENFVGVASFDYTISDGTLTDTATVTVTVTAVNDAPVAVADSATTDEDTLVSIPVLSNDTDTEGDTLVIKAGSVSTPSNGVAVINGNNIDYTPNANFTGSDSFTYIVNDGTADGNEVTVTVSVGGVNDAPVAVDDTATVAEDTALTLGVADIVTPNDTDIDGDALTITAVSNPSNGSVVLNEDGTVTFTPSENFVGEASFEYTISDGTLTDTATVTVNVTAVNDAPVGVTESATTDEDTAVVIDVLANDNDTEGDTLTITNLSTPSNGTVAIVDGKITYTPNANFTGSDSFTYTPNDGTADGEPVTVTVSVGGVNDAPVAVDDTATVAEDTALTLGVADIVTPNDTDADGDALTITAVSNPSNGSVVLNEDGTVTFTPSENFVGEASFEYTISDGTLTDTATVTVNVTAVNDAPVGVTESATTDEDTAVVIDVLANDNDTEGDTLTITNLSTPSNGSVAIVDGKVTYTPNANFTGSDSFTYTPNDGTADGEPVTVTVSVGGVNDAPVAVDDTATVAEDTAVDIPVLSNDSDIDGDSLSISSTTTPSHGTVVINPDGTISYTPEVNYNGSDSFTYTISDGNGESGTATITVTIDAVNDAPVGTEDAESINEDTVLNIAVLTNDTDTEGDILSIANLTNPSNGTVEINGTNITYTPNENFVGIDSFTYRPNDGNLNGDPVVVRVTVLADTDGDGIIDDNDLDDDNDGITDEVELEGNPTRDTDGDGVIDSLDLDSDNDGILDLVESGQDATTVDANNDGVLDSTTDADNDGLMDVADVDDNNPESIGNVVPVDTDSDGVRDFQDVDSDNDGISDLMEGIIDPSNDSNGDGMIDGAVDDNGIPTMVPSVISPTDTDGDGVPNYQDLDSDNDDLLDVVEVNGTDENHDGLIDTADTLVPVLIDTDGNSVADVNEPNNPNLTGLLDTNHDGVIDDATDSDGDGIPDVTDGADTVYGTQPLQDSDGDGIADIYDLDDDNDGIPDLVEEVGDPLRDTDGDGVVDSKDLDSDNDGILDIIEVNGVDADKNGRVDDTTDSDNDGLVDGADANPNRVDTPTDRLEALMITTTTVIDTDGDSKPDFQDVDSDSDGISDLIEGGLDALVNDTNNDGMVDGAVDDNGVPTMVPSVISPTDTDGDGVYDYRDLDSDNDGLNDVAEVGGVDEDADGLIDGNTLIDILIDTDGNSIPDVSEPSNPNLPAAIDSNGDGIIDNMLDSDGDGIPDVFDAKSDSFGSEALSDHDKDGIVDLYDLDDDNDGIPDVIENDGMPTRDSDGDGVIDRFDLDSDNDGLLDILEANGVDGDNNGLVDDAADSDNDGLADVADKNPENADNPSDKTEAVAIMILNAVDTDNDGIPDFQDIDSDNDGISDVIESGIDTAINDENNDGRLDGDVDENGIPKIATPIQVPADTDTDGIPDYRDKDADNDGLTDVLEAGGEDSDADGKVDTFGTLIPYATLLDEDNDGLKNYRDFDALIFPDTLFELTVGEIITVDVLANDETEALDVSTLQIVGTKAARDSLVVEGEGVWSIEDGKIIFTPEEGFEYDPTAISYFVENSYGQKQPAVSVTLNYLPKARPDKEVADLTKPITVHVLENDNGDLDETSVQIVLPEGFMNLNPLATLDENRKVLVVPGQGTWHVNSDGSITYTAEEGYSSVQPTPISYRVYDKAGNLAATDAVIEIVAAVVAGVSDENCECESYTSKSVPSFTKIGLGLMALMGGLIGLLLFRKETNKQ